ncbi:MAG: Mur ligase [Xanthomonadales bacterium]|nr:Mur ligase [Xanthomonadales bacterium]
MLDVPATTPAFAQRWVAQVRALRAELGWPADAAIVTRLHRDGASFAAAAADDQLFTATEVNELAWLRLVAQEHDAAWPLAPAYPAVFDHEAARQTLQRSALAERAPRLMALLQEAQRRALGVLCDDEMFSLGGGHGSRTWPLQALPESVDWSTLSDVPTALITGSNGKTTTVRLVAAMAAAAGRSPGFNCTDGVFVDGECVLRGDYSGPAGARAVLRDPRVQTAVLETARGGILRRGLAVRRADAAIVTNVSPDHFGEYGVHDLADLADAKLVVARALGPAGTLVLNADDPLLVAKSAALTVPLAWFAQDDAHPLLLAARERGGGTCAVAGGRLRLYWRGVAHDLGAVAAMPLTVAGSAAYNIANLAGAALLAAALGIGVESIAAVCQHFGARRDDNPGRLERWRIGDVDVLVDYAHNPEGLEGLLQVAEQLRKSRDARIGLLLGQAGNRDDSAIRALAQVAAAHRPSRIVLKDIPGMLRGRAPGEVPGLLREGLLDTGFAAADLHLELDELEAARQLWSWSRPGDVLVLPVHAAATRLALAQWLDALQR